MGCRTLCSRPVSRGGKRLPSTSSNLVLSWSVAPTPWKRSIEVLGFQTWGPVSAHQIWSHFSSCCFKIFELWFARELARTSLLSSTNVKEAFAGERTLWLALSSIFSLHVLPRTPMWPSSTSTKPSTPHESKALWFGCSTPVCQIKCGSWCPISAVALNHRSVLGPPSPNLGLTPVLLRVLAPLLFNLLVSLQGSFPLSTTC